MGDWLRINGDASYGHGTDGLGESKDGVDFRMSPTGSSTFPVRWQSNAMVNPLNEWQHGAQ